MTIRQRGVATVLPVTAATLKLLLPWKLPLLLPWKLHWHPTVPPSHLLQGAEGQPPQTLGVCSFGGWPLQVFFLVKTVSATNQFILFQFREKRKLTLGEKEKKKKKTIHCSTVPASKVMGMTQMRVTRGMDSVLLTLSDRLFSLKKKGSSEMP